MWAGAERLAEEVNVGNGFDLLAIEKPVTLHYDLSRNHEIGFY